MLVTILSRPVELKINTVSLSNNGTDKLNLYRCWADGGAVAQYLGTVVKIRPTFEPSLDNLVVHKCATCNELYAFQTHDGYQKKSIDVVMRVDPYTSDPWHCCICRRPIATYSHEDFIKEAYTHALLQFPASIKCSNVTCPANYLFTDAV